MSNCDTPRSRSSSFDWVQVSPPPSPRNQERTSGLQSLLFQEQETSLSPVSLSPTSLSPTSLSLGPSPDSSRSSSPIPDFKLPLFPQDKVAELPPKEPVKLAKTQLTTTQLVILVPIVVGIETTKFAYRTARSITSFLTGGII